MPNHILYPSPLRRFGVVIYDSLLIIAVSFIYGYIYIAISKLVFNIETDSPSGFLFQVGWLLTVISFYTYFWKKGGQTTGMRAWRIEIQSKEGHSPSIPQCILRLATAPIGWLLFATSFFHPQQQWLHDILSQTQLVLIPKPAK